MGFEDNFLAKLDQKRRHSDINSQEVREGTFETARTRAEKFGVQNEIQIRDFEDTYGPEVIKQDEEYVQKMEEVFNRQSSEERSNAQYASIMEAILCEQIELSDWMGPNVSTIKTSRYDDIKHGTDFIVEFGDQPNSLSHLGMAIDVTFGANAIADKFKKIQQEIESGKLTEIKYFESQSGRYKGRLRKLPRVIIGVEKPMILKLSKVWLDSSLKKDFASHPVQITFLEEIREQLQVFSKYAELVNQNEVARVYLQDVEIIEQILKERKETAFSAQIDDRVRDSIQYNLNLFGN